MHTHNRPASAARRACAAWVALACWATARPVLAQEPMAAETPPPPVLVDPGVAAFSSEQLAQALLARAAPAEGAGRRAARVVPDGSGGVTVQIEERSRQVALGGRTGPAAARVVALVITELMTSAAEPTADAQHDEAAGPKPPAVIITGTAPGGPAVPAAASPPAPSPTPPARVYLTGGVAKGAGAEELPAGTLDADLMLALGPRLRLAAAAGLVYMPTRNPAGWNEVGFVSAAGRVLGGASWGPVDLMGGPFVAGYNIRGSVSHAGALFGAEALVRVAAPLSRRTRLVFATRFHAYGNRTRAFWQNNVGYATPRLELTLGIGLAWDWPS